MNANSERTTPSSCSDRPVVAILPWLGSGIVPLVPIVRESGLGRVSAKDEGNELPEDGVGLALAEELGNTFEGEDPSEGLENSPDVRQRLRTFHTV